MKRKKTVTPLLFSLVFFISGCSSAAYGKQDTVETDMQAQSIIENMDASIYLTTEHKTYAPDIPYITLFITNNQEDTVEFGLAFTMEQMIEGKWTDVPYHGGWNDVGIILSPGETYAQQIYMTEFDPLPDGEYRFTKDIGGEFYIANFFLGESPYSAETSFGYEPLADLPLAYSLEEALADGVVTIAHDGSYENFFKLDDFIRNYSLNVPAMVRTMQWTVEGEPVLTDILYQDGYFQVIQDIRRDSFGYGDYWESTYSFLNLYTMEDTPYFCLSNQGTITDWSEKSPLYIIGPVPEENTNTLDTIFCIEQNRHEFLKEYQNKTTYAVLFNKENASLSFGFEQNGFGMMETLTGLPESYNWLELFWIDNASFAMTAGDNHNKTCFIYDMAQKKIAAQYEGNCFAAVEDFGFIFAKQNKLLDQSETEIAAFEDHIVDLIPFTSQEGEALVMVVLENGREYTGTIPANTWNPL